jgi:hypothetical protein
MSFLALASSTISRALGKDVPVLPFTIGELSEHNDGSSMWAMHNGVKKVRIPGSIFLSYLFDLLSETSHRTIVRK